jgi:hypothetical protein
MNLRRNWKCLFVFLLGKRLNLRTVFDNHGDQHSILFVWEKIH